MKWGTYPSKAKWDNFDASSNALVQVGPGRGFSPLFVPSQWWFPPEAAVTLWPVVMMIPSKMVFIDPPIRKMTSVGWFGAAHESKASTATTVRGINEASFQLCFFWTSISWVGSVWAAFLRWIVLIIHAQRSGSGQGINKNCQTFLTFDSALTRPHRPSPENTEKCHYVLLQSFEKARCIAQSTSRGRFEWCRSMKGGRRPPHWKRTR